MTDSKPPLLAIETHVVEIAAAMKNFLAANGVGRLKEQNERLHDEYLLLIS